MPTLDDIKPGNGCVVTRIVADGQLAQRLMDLGIFPTASVRLVRNAPLVDPIDLEVDGFHVSLRHDEAKFVEVEPS